MTQYYLGRIGSILKFWTNNRDLFSRAFDYINDVVDGSLYNRKTLEQVGATVDMVNQIIKFEADDKDLLYRVEEHLKLCAATVAYRNRVEEGPIPSHMDTPL